MGESLSSYLDRPPIHLPMLPGDCDQTFWRDHVGSFWPTVFALSASSDPGGEMCGSFRFPNGGGKVRESYPSVSLKFRLRIYSKLPRCVFCGQVGRCTSLMNVFWVMGPFMRFIRFYM